MAPGIVSCSFVVLYEHGTRDQLELTLASVSRFAEQHCPETHNPFDLLVICGDSRRGSIDKIPKSAFESAKLLDRSGWDLPGERDFGPWPVVWNLGNIALKRVSCTVMMLSCGSRISGSDLAAEALSLAYSDRRIASLSVSPSSEGGLSPNGIVFTKGPGWSNLAAGMNGVVVAFRKGLFGGVRCRAIGTGEAASYSDAQLIGAIAYDYERDRYGYGERVVLGRWAE